MLPVVSIAVRWDSPFILHSSSPTAIPVTVIFPPFIRFKHDEDTRLETTFRSDADLESFSWRQGGGFIVRLMADGDLEVMRFKDLVAGETYFFTRLGVGMSNMEGQLRRKAAHTLEVEATQAVAAEVRGNAHVHYNVIHVSDDKKDIFKLDGAVVLRGGETEPDSVAYVVEKALEPDVRKVDRALRELQRFKDHAKDMQHFKTVKTFVSVLGGRVWSKDVIDECDKNSIWRVAPFGGGYKVEKPKAASVMLPGDGLKRTFATLAVQLARKLR